MFHKKKGPDKPFAHSEDCKILKADPGVQIEWSEEQRGHWVARCVCGEEHYHEPAADRRVRLDPLDPSTSQHLPQCEFASTADRDVLKVLLRLTPKDGYVWTECPSCEVGWQVLDYAPASAVRT